MNIYTESVVSVVRSAAKQIMPEPKYEAFLVELHRHAKFMTPLGAIDVMCELQRIHTTPAARNVLGKGIAKLRELEVAA